MKVSRFTFLVLLTITFLVACKKSDDTPPEEEQTIIKPEWRVKRITNTTTGLKLDYGLDSTDFTYDSRGRITDLTYGLRIWNTSPFYEEKLKLHYRYDYFDTTERIQKVSQLLKSGFYSPYAEEYKYNTAGKLESIKIISTTGVNTTYQFEPYSGKLPTDYTFLYHTEYYDDTTVTNLTYNKELIIKKVDTRYHGENVNISIYDYNTSGNVINHFMTGGNSSINKDTIRSISFSWIPTITPNTTKIKRLPEYYSQVKLNSIGGGLFYFNTYCLLIEMDIFNLTSNGELLKKYRWTRMRNNLMPNEMNFDYQLDANNNIGKIIGKTINGKGILEMNIEYDKIQY